MNTRVTPNINLPIAWVAFDNHQSAAMAIEQLNGQDLFKTGEPVYVGWFKTRRERELEFESQLTPNETKLYIRDLKLDTTKDMLKEGFLSFGQALSSSVRTIEKDGKTLKFGFV